MMIQTIEMLNNDIRDNERSGNAGFFEKHLTDDFIFRRTNGTLVSKQEFIAGLKGREWRVLENHRVRVAFNEKHTGHAAATLLVDFDFTDLADGKEIKGCAKNIRFFRLEDGVWKVYAWYNEMVDV